MAYFNKVGMIILSDDEAKFLTCVKNYFTSDFILPGGRFKEGETDKGCLIREIKEELDVETDETSLEFSWRIYRRSSRRPDQRCDDTFIQRKNNRRAKTDKRNY